VIVFELAALERRDPPAPERRRADSRREASGTGPSAADDARRRARELAVAELRAVAPAGHSFGRRGR
jgi:hypothetical protein